MTEILKKCQDVLKRFDSIYETYLYEDGDRTIINSDEIASIQSLNDEIWQFSKDNVGQLHWGMLSTICISFDRLTDVLQYQEQDFNGTLNAMSHLSDLYSMIRDF